MYTKCVLDFTVTAIIHSKLFISVKFYVIMSQLNSTNS